MNTQIKYTVKKIKEGIMQIYKDDLVSILLYGSVLTNKKAVNDIDLVVVTKNKEREADIKKIRELVSSFDMDIDLQIICASTINSYNFSHDTHGIFIVDFLKRVEIIYGVNPFSDISVSYELKINSVINKLQYYYFRAKKFYINPKLSESQNLDFHKKKIMMMVRDFNIIYMGVSDFKNTDMRKINKKIHESIGSLEKINFGLDPSFGNIFKIYRDVFYEIYNTLNTKQNYEKEDFYISDIFCKKNTRKENDNLYIICSGLPSNYEESDIVNFLNIRGYDTLCMQYSSTGMSGGSGMYKGEEDLGSVINYNKDKYKSIKIIGNSFAGHPIFRLNKKYTKLINKIILISPVFNLGSVRNVNTLEDYLISEQRGFYRFGKGFIKKIIAEESLNLLHIEKTFARKINIVHGTDDRQIPLKDIRSFATKNNINISTVKDGHISLKKMTNSHLEYLSKLL